MNEYLGIKHLCIPPRQCLPVTEELGKESRCLWLGTHDWVTEDIAFHILEMYLRRKFSGYTLFSNINSTTKQPSIKHLQNDRYSIMDFTYILSFISHSSNMGNIIIYILNMKIVAEKWINLPLYTQLINTRNSSWLSVSTEAWRTTCYVIHLVKLSMKTQTNIY